MATIGKRKKTADGRDLLGVRAYAAYRKNKGLPRASVSSVQSALAEGVIARTCDRHERCGIKCTRGGFDPLQADADWSSYDAAQGEVSDSSSYSDARTALMVLKARHARMELEEATGNLVSKDEVITECFRQYRLFRNAMLNLPRRISGAIASKCECGQIKKPKLEETLEDEIGKALEEIQLWESKGIRG